MLGFPYELFTGKGIFPIALTFQIRTSRKIELGFVGIRFWLSHIRFFFQKPDTFIKTKRIVR
jgi:hypothetical protein